VCGPERILTTEEAASLLARLNAIVEQEEALAGGEWWEREFYPQRQEDHPLNARWLDELVAHPAVLNRVQSLIGPDLLIQNVAIFWKEPSTTRGQAWHRDLYEDIDPNHMVTVWIALTESDAESGCVDFLAGSHDVHRSERPTDDALASIPQEMAMRMELRPGEASFHNAGVLHCSSPNLSKRPRVGIALRYVGSEVDRRGASEVLQATLVRGEDSLQQYSLIPRYCVLWWSAASPRTQWNTRPPE